MSYIRAGGHRRPWSRPRASTLGLLLCLGCIMSLAGAVQDAAARPLASPLSSRVAPEQRLAVLSYGHRAFRKASMGSRVLAIVAARRPITREVTTLPVLAQTTDQYGQQWLKVMLPGRPNGSTGWIQRAGTQQRFTTWYIAVSLSARRVWVFRRGVLKRTFSAVVGKPSTPTPAGRFFVEESVAMPASEPGGPFALALSGRSNVLHEFANGPGEIAIHGRDSLGGTPGQAQSHGCIRLTTPNIEWLAARIAPGTPVTITRAVPAAVRSPGRAAGSPAT